MFDERIEIRRFLARGGMGAVYEGFDRQTERPVAVKILQEHASDPLFRRRFFNEAAMCASLVHPNVVQVFHFGVTDDGVCFIVMELLVGETLGALLKRERVLSPDRALRVLRQVCGALAAAHARGIVHRDLKPANVWVLPPRADETDADGPRVKVLDFGLAKRVQQENGLTQTGIFLGSPSYVSPEQIRGVEVGPQADIYTCGLLLYRMVAGVNPFRREAVSATLLAQATQPPPTFAELGRGLPPMPQIEWVARNCLEKDPKARFRTVEDLDRALDLVEQVLRGEVSEIDLRLEDGSLVLARPTVPAVFRAVLPTARPAPLTLLGVGLVMVGAGLIAVGLLLVVAAALLAS